jgi:glycosyltransferase involved in cell wall biosynthesis
MRVAWLNEAAVGKDAAGKVTGGLASVRYRCLIPQEALKADGVESFLLGRIDKANAAAFSQAMDQVKPDIAVIGKVFSRQVLELLPLLKQRGIKVVADFCDNHFAKPETGPVHRALIEAADAVVAATPMMAEAIAAATGNASTLIPDPYEGPHGAPKFAPGPTLKLLWFGGRTNIDTIGPALPSLNELGKTQPLSLTIFTDPEPQLDRLIETARDMFRNVAIIFLPWSLEGQWQAIADCDAVIIPSLDNDTKNVKGPNRLIEAIRGGRPVAAYPLPSYQAFADVCWLNPDVAEGLKAMLADPAAAAPKVETGQRLVDERHGPKRIAGRWLKLFEETAKAPSAAAAAQPAAKGNGAAIRLNLGCGDKVLPGYVNIDLVDERAGHKPDIICDVRKLAPLPDAYADEAMAIHVVEHFWRWEVVEILKEWRRVLKPGGKIILECPNLLSACEAVLKNPEMASGPGKEGQRSMWVLYGDPSWKDPLMCHRWAYTPQSLGAVMQQAGFTQIRQEPAQYKLREPRDMRVTGIKP